MKENKELKEALELLEKEKDISKETLLEAIENSLIQACKTHFGKADNVKAIVDRETCNFSVYAEREVVEEVEDPVLQISLEDAREIDPHLGIGDIARVEIKSKEFGRIATQNAKNVILQKIREEERDLHADREDQGLYSGSEGYHKGSPDPGVQDASGAGEASV